MSNALGLPAWLLAAREIAGAFHRLVDDHPAYGRPELECCYRAAGVGVAGAVGSILFAAGTNISRGGPGDDLAWKAWQAWEDQHKAWPCPEVLPLAVLAAAEQAILQRDGWIEEDAASGLARETEHDA
jgi:hypothetical protein